MKPNVVVYNSDEYKKLFNEKGRLIDEHHIDNLKRLSPKDKLLCSYCNSYYSRSNKTNHIRTKKHMKNVASST